MKELFSHDPLTGMTVWFHSDDSDPDKVHLEYEQDAEPVIEFNKAAQREGGYSAQGIKDEMWHYASIPNGVAMKWLIEDGLDIYDDNAWPQIFRKLNDPEYAYLKATTKNHRKQQFKATKAESIIVTGT